MLFSSLIFSNIFNSFEIHLIFNSSKSHAPFLMCSIFHILNHSINFKNFVVMMSVSWRCFLNGVSIGHEIWTTDIVLDNNYWKTFAWFGRLIPKPPFFTLPTQCNWKTNYDELEVIYHIEYAQRNNKLWCL